MRIVTCLVHDHNPWVVLLAAAMCVVGSAIAVGLFRRTLTESGTDRHHWCFLSAVTAGAAIWATHFIAMLGYQPGVPVTFDAPMTIVSVVIATTGTGIGLYTASSKNRIVATIGGGGIVGLSIAAMHYVGMFAYRADGIVHWLPAYVIASLILAVLFAAAAIDRLRDINETCWRPKGIALLVLAIVTLHFVGMAAYSVTPIAGYRPGIDSEAFVSMASAVALVALFIFGTGMSAHLLEKRTRSESREKLHHIAHHDSLTGLANRHSFTEALEIEFQKSVNVPFVLMMIDLDRFKPINDTLGHPAGDEVLRKVAQRLHHAVREHDLVARIGGDEFAVIAYDVSDRDTAEDIGRRIVEILARPFIVEGNVAELSASVGIALAPDHGADAETLTQNADVALYSAKADGKNCLAVFEHHLSESVQERRALEAELRRACMRENFRVVYQPVLDAKTGQYAGAEALVRWTAAERGPISPAIFIPIAEELGLVSRIGAFVLRTACTEAASWRNDLTISVNISTVQLLDPRLPQLITQALQESGLPAHRLDIEITETALLSNDELALRSLNQLRDLGVGVSLDDFGTGYSSLSYLHRFPFSRIKIDQSFVQRLPHDIDSASIIRAVAQLGNGLGVKITAEGIETDEQYAFIAEHGCDNMQGYLISKPIEVTEIHKLFGCADASTAKSAA